jgi:hypothetical protein
MSGLKENGMSTGEVLAAVNKKFIIKNPEPYKFPPGFPATTMVLSHTFWYSKVELDQRNKVEGCNV